MYSKLLRVIAFLFSFFVVMPTLGLALTYFRIVLFVNAAEQRDRAAIAPYIDLPIAIICCMVLYLLIRWQLGRFAESTHDKSMHVDETDSSKQVKFRFDSALAILALFFFVGIFIYDSAKEVYQLRQGEKYGVLQDRSLPKLGGEI